MPLDHNASRADGAADLPHTALQPPTADARSGGYGDLTDAAVVVITAGSARRPAAAAAW